MTPLLTPEQAAKELGIGVDTLAAMRKAGEIPYVNIGRGEKRETPRFDLDDLIAWKEARKTRCQSSKSGRPIRFSRSRSTSTVSDFREARERLLRARQKSRRPVSGTKREPK